MAEITKLRRIVSIAVILIMLLSVFNSVSVSAASSDAYANLPYYFVDFEDGYNFTNVGTTAIVNGGAGGSGKCLKIDESASLPYGDYLIIKPGPAVLTGSVPAGGTLRISFWTKLGQVMKTDRAYFTFIMSKAEGGYVLDSTGNHPMVLADGTSTDWQKITCDIPVAEQSNITAIYIRTALGGGISNQLPNGSDPTNPGGARTYYLDDMEIQITCAEKMSTSSDFAVAGTVAQGQQITFSHTFTPSTSGATDKSLVRLVCADENGNKVSLGTTGIGDAFTVPALPCGRKLAFEVVPIDSAGVVGKTVTYGIVTGSAYLVADFESGEAWNTDRNVYALTDGPGVSKYALSVTDTLPEFDFGLRARSDYDENGDGTVDGKWKYDVSMWIRADANVTNDKVELIFKLKNQSTGSGDPATLEETVTISSAGLKSGEWVKVKLSDMVYDGKTKGMYDGKIFDYEKDYATLPDGGTVRVRVSDGIAYSIDDLVIMPERYAPYQEIISTSLDDVTALNSPWSVTDATGEFNTSYKGNVVGSETIGNAVTITNNEENTASALQYATSPRPPLKFGIDYTVECMVKAENEKAVGLVPTMLALYYDRTDTENLPNNHTQIDYDRRKGTISNSWQKFKWNFKMDYLTTDAVSMYLSIRLTGEIENIKGAKWSIANVKMYPTEDKFTNLTATSKLTGEKLADGTVLADFASSVLTGQVKTCISRIEVPYEDDYVIYKSFDSYKSEDSFLYNEGSLDGARVVSIATDKDDYFGSESIVPITFSSQALTATAEFGQAVWAPDMPTLTAKIRYNDATGDETLLALCATYDENGKMVSYDNQELVLTAGEGEVNLSMETGSTSVKAKIFLWEDSSYAPRFTDIKEIDKTTSGTFIYVDSKKGNENSVYGYANPLKTVHQAVEAANTVMTSNPSDVYIILMPGTHSVTKEINITEEMTDSAHNVKFVSYDKHDISTISGGRNLTGAFTHHENGIYKTQIEKSVLLRDLYVNGEKAIKARSRELANTEFTNLNVISLHGAGGSYVSETGVGLKTASSEWVKLKNYKRVQDIEFVFHRLWFANRCQVSGITNNGDGSITLAMDNLAWNTMATGVDMFVESPLYIENAYELLDEPGEWYLDSMDGIIYYMPRAGEDISTAEVILPVVDNYNQKLVNISGTNSERVNNLSFENVEFAHTTWSRPSTAYGHVVLQNNVLRDFYDKDTYVGNQYLRLPESAIDVDYASNIEFVGCKFTKLGSNGIRFYTNVSNANLTGNEFYDISASAICVGDYEKVVNGKNISLCRDANIENVTISNNYIHDVARDFWSAAALGVSWAKNTTISNNEICNIPYTGIHAGLGWNYETGAALTDLTINIENNYIHHLFQGYIYDGGAIYTNGLSGGTKQNPNKICGNYVTDIGPGAACIYNDNGSTAYLVENNFMDARNSFSEICRTTGEEKGTSRSMNINVQGSYRDHDLVWRNNYSATRKCMVQPTALIDLSNYIDYPIFIGEDGTWNDEVRAIIENAGIQESYKKNFECGLQALKVAKTIELNVGESISSAPIFKTSKGVIYKNKNLVFSASSNNPAVARIENGQIIAVGKGSATITYNVVENGIRYQAKTGVYVK